MIRPEQMPYTNPMGQTYDSGKFESVQTQALALADWAGFDARAAQSQGQWQASRPRHGVVPGMDRRQRVRGARHRQRLGRRLHRGLQRHAGHGPGHRHQLCAAGGGRVRRADREGAHRAGRHRPRQRLRQRRLALDLRRRLGRPGGLPAHGGKGAGPGRRGAGNRAQGHRVPRRRVPRGRHRPADRPVRAGRQAEPTTRSSSIPPARCRRRAGPTPATSARSRSTPTPARWRWRAMRRSTTSAAPSTRPSSSASSTAARCRAWARRCASRWSTSASPASCRPAR